MRPFCVSSAAAASGRQTSATRLAARNSVMVHLLFVHQQKEAERTRRERQQPEEQKAERVGGERAQLDLVAEEIELAWIDHGEEQHLAEAAREERRPQHHGPPFHHASRVMRHVPRGSSITMCQRPLASGSGGASWAPLASRVRRRRTSCPARVACARCTNSTSGAAPLSCARVRSQYRST